MAIDNSTVLGQVLHFGISLVFKLENIHPYHIFYGYAKLISMPETTLRLMFEDEASKDNLEEARRFFKDKQLDVELIKVGIPIISSYLPKMGDFCQKQIDRIVGKKTEVYSYQLLTTLLDAEDEMFTVFRNGEEMADILEFQTFLKRTQEEPEGDSEPAESNEGANGPEAEESTESSGDVEAAESTEGSGDAEVEESTEGPEDIEAAESTESSGNPESEESSEGAEDSGQEEFFEDEDDFSLEGIFDDHEAGSDAQEKMKEGFLELSNTYRKLRMDLLSEVKGQDDPVLEFVQGCFEGAVLGRGDKRKLPEASFLFVGPPGVGKTLLAQTAAESLGRPCKMFNMSEFAAAQSYEGLIGVSSFYKDSEEGQLVKFVRKNPKCILIFDEIEKAHRKTIQLFLQILDLGSLENVYLKKTTSFKDAIIIFTSNACRDIYENSTGNIAKTPKNVILNALKNEMDPTTGQPVFPNAICSRIAAGNLIMFNHLSVRNLTNMISDNFHKVAEQMKAEYGYQVSCDPRLPLLFLFHYGTAMDARIASRQSDVFLKKELFELMRQVESHPGMMDGIENIYFDIDLETEDPEIESLFRKPKKPEIVVICEAKHREYFASSSIGIVHFAENMEDLKRYLQEDISFVVIDLMYGLEENGIRGVSLDDYCSTGIQAFRQMEEEGGFVPVYLLETEKPMTETDRSTFFQKGARGIISLDNATVDSVGRQIEQISDEIYMEIQGQKFSRSGHVLDFNTAQIPDGATMRIQYHELTKHQAIDAENASLVVADAERPTIGFADVIGAENAKDELQYFIRYLSNPRKFIREGGKPAKGVLLYGPPGTGKTMLARAMAGESKVAFIQTSATEFLNKFIGQSEQNVRNLFKMAKKYAPAIIFIDEIDAVGKTRDGSAQTTESVLNTLLTELDGFKVDVKNPVFVLAATNYRVEADGSDRMTLDPALVRRFDNRICVDLPKEKERLQYLKMSVERKGFKDVDEADLRNIAARTTGLSIAILQNVVDLAFRNAGKKGHLPDGNDLQNALEEYNYGERKDWGADYYRSVAIHESGHAYLAWKSGETPSYMTIESRGNFGGYMMHENGENKPRYTKEELFWKIRCSLGGRAAEQIFYGKEAAANTGASADLQNATNQALSMLCNYGMMEGNMVALPFNIIANTSLAASYLEQVNRLLQEEMETTLKIVEEGKDKVQNLAEALLQNNHLTGEEILAVLER